MNKNNAKDFLPLVQALVDGKTIQYQCQLYLDWVDCGEVDFTSDVKRYRIKPEPLEVDLWIHTDGRIREGYGTRSQPHQSNEWRKIRVREIV